MRTTWINAWILGLFIAGTLFVGCGGESEPDTNPPQMPSAPEQGPEARKSERGTEKETAAGKQEEQTKDTQKKTEEEEEEQVELDVDLPQPTFAGTPSDLQSRRLEPDGGPRGNVMVPQGTQLLSEDKPVSASSDTVMGSLDQVTDGVKEAGEGNYVTLPPGSQWVQIDLEKNYHLDAVLIWHYHASARVYHDVVVQVSTDPGFEENVTTLFNNDYDNSLGFGQGKDYEYVDDFEGKLVKAAGSKARYVRVYGNGNTANELNHFTEVSVYGRPVEQ